MHEESARTTRPNLSFTYNASERTFLFLSDTLERPLNAGTHDFLSWFEQMCGLSRVRPETGKSFSVIGAPFAPSPGSNALLTRGLFLSDEPAILSGICTPVEPTSINYLIEPERNELAALLRDWDAGAAKNIIHALKAPVNRIRGIASIMRQELGDHPEWDQLIAYLEHSSERLNRLSVHLLQIDEGEKPAAVSLDTLLLNAVKTADEYTRHPVVLNELKQAIVIDGLIALRLERLITNILTSPHPESTGERSVSVEQIDAKTLQINCYDRIKVPQLQQHQQEVLSSEEIPEGTLELIRDCEDAIVIRSFENETTLCQKVIVPMLSSSTR